MPPAAAGSAGSAASPAGSASAGSAAAPAGSDAPPPAGAGPATTRGHGKHRRPAPGAGSAAPPIAPSGATAPPDPPAGTGPTIVGGGSAADHGVILGPNVVTGPSVIIGSATPQFPMNPSVPTSLSRPADYDPKRFDPVAYLPRAQKLARELLPDAQLTSFEFDPVFSDGHVDLTVDGRDREYEFRSPERSAFPAGRPRNLPIDRACRVHIEVGVRTVSARVLTSDSCDARLIHPPRCSLASVWKQALASGTPGDLVARIAWLHDETWFFDVDLAGKGGGVSSFADRCR
jgi:hypothetical protein